LVEARCIVCGQNAVEPVLERSTKLSDLFLGRMEALSGSRFPLKPVAFPLVRCLHCSFIFVAGARQADQDAQRATGPRSAEERARIDFDDPALDLERARPEHMAAHRPLLEKIESLAPKGLLLDVGAGLGWLLAAARERGWKVSGTELNDSLIEYARDKLDLEVTRGHLRDLGFRDRYCEVVTMFDVLEHVFDVEETLAELRRILKPEGLLVIRVPNVGSLRARIDLESWPHLNPGHISYFSDATLSALLTRFGFEVLEIESWIPDSFVHLAETDPHFANFLFHPSTQEFFRGGAYGDYITCFARNQPAARQAWRLAGWDSAVAGLASDKAELQARLDSIYARPLVRAYRWVKRVLRGGR